MRRAGFAFASLIALTALAGLAAATPQTRDGAAIFARNCSSCHDGADGSRAPSPDILKRRSPEAILSALTAGGMRPQGGRLSGAERRAVAEYLSGRALGGDITGARVGRCSSSSPLIEPSSSPGWIGWSPSVTNTRFQTTQQAGLTADQVPRLSLKWAFGFPDATSAWSQPTVASGRLFVGSQNGTVYSLDAKSGCIHWMFSAKSGVRTALSFGPRGDGGFAVYFGDTGANVYALDAATGRELWSRRLDDHLYARITGSPTLYQDRLYVPVSSMEETAASQQGYECCTFRGSLNALDVRTGAIVWRTFMVPEAQAAGKNAAGVALWGPSGVGIWSAPTIDARRGLVYAGTGNTYSAPAQPTADAIVAFSLETGAIRWIKQLTAGDVFGCRAGSANCGEKAGPDFDLGTPPMLVTVSGRDVIVAAQKSGNAFAIDPEKEGALLWQYHAGEGSIWGGIQWGAAVDGERAYFPVSDIRTPKPGGLHAVGLSSGERAWYVPPPPLTCTSGTGCSAALISAPTLIPGVLFSGSNDGALRAHSTRDGSVIWEFDTNREFETLNGVRAGGGAIQGPGPTIAGGMLYLNSGYGDHLGRPGNVLLAFEVQ
ncbi:MAG TPA: PQQ-binding-like beta-propeller repeat protein [Vicinamibacterales bacterium]|nr:PQQ-binding-like beta-propeller repeat protein [Vicinamibacterales bacterium]